MQVPVELVVWIGSILVGGLGCLGSFMVHLLIRILNNQSRFNETLSLMNQRLEQVERVTV